MSIYRKIFLTSFVLFLCVTSVVDASHNTSRYFPFLEKTEEYLVKKGSYFYPALFVTTGSTAFARSGGNTGIPELWGRYDLKSMISATEAWKISQGATDYNPFGTETGYSDWNEKELKFLIDGKVRSRGILLGFEQDLFGTGASFGCSVPLMHVNTSLRFSFDSANSHSDARDVTLQEEEMLDRVRRRVHCDLGLKGADWTKAGLGDLDIHARWRHELDHKFKTKTINLVLQAGAVAPTGVKADKDYASSVPFMGNGHWSLYGDFLTEIELKQNWRLGFLLGLMHQFKKTDKRRISYHDEPPIFAPLVGDVEIDPGLTIKISSYFTLENVMDGVNFQARYTYLRHNSDTWVDRRADKSVASYVCSTLSGSDAVRWCRKRLSSWRSHYVTLQVDYDSAEATKHWLFEPKFYALLDYAFTGKGICKTHQFTVGAELHLW